MYTVENYRTKADLKRAVANGDRVLTYQPGGIFAAQTDGVAYIEGPHYPAAHTWYAQVMLKDRCIIKVMK